MQFLTGVSLHRVENVHQISCNFSAGVGVTRFLMVLGLAFLGWALVEQSRGESHELMSDEDREKEHFSFSDNWLKVVAAFLCFDIVCCRITKVDGFSLFSLGLELGLFGQISLVRFAGVEVVSTKRRYDNGR